MQFLGFLAVGALVVEDTKVEEKRSKIILKQEKEKKKEKHVIKHKDIAQKSRAKRPYKIRRTHRNSLFVPFKVLFRAMPDASGNTIGTMVTTCL